MSAGITTFENGAYSLNKSKQIQNYLDKDPSIGHPETLGHYLTADDFVQNLKKSFRNNFPELTQNREIVFVSCAELGEGQRTLYTHSGRHPQMIETVMNDKGYSKICKQLKEQLQPGTRTLVVYLCRDGKYKSVAVLESHRKAIIENGFEGRPEKCTPYPSKGTRNGTNCVETAV